MSSDFAHVETFSRKAWGTLSQAPAPLAVAALSLTGYLSTLAPSITWKNGGIDSGELALAASQLGVAHPTGYPLYVLLGYLFTWLPWGDPAFRLNLFSALSAAASAAVLALAVSLACPDAAPRWARHLAAAVAGLMLAFSPTLWSQAVITEVYALHSLFVSTNLALLLALARRGDAPGQRTLLALGCLALGLALTHHATIALFAPGTGLYLWLIRGHLPRLSRRELALGLGLFLLGTSPYLLLPVRASQQPVANWGDPQTLPHFLTHVSARAYTGLVAAPSLARLPRVPAAARLLLEQFGWPGFLLLTTGCWVLWHRNRPLAWHLALSGTLVLLHAIHYRGRDAEVYLLPLYILLALALGVGSAAALTLLSGWLPHSEHAAWRTGVQGLLPRLALAGAALALALLPPASYLQHRGAVDVSNDDEAMTYAREVLDSLAPEAAIFTQEDQETFSLWYAHFVLRQRPDVLVLDARLLAWPWYRDNLRRLYPTIPWPAGSSLSVPQAVEATRPRPLYFTYPDPGYPVIPHGRVYARDSSRTGTSVLGSPIDIGGNGH